MRSSTQGRERCVIFLSYLQAKSSHVADDHMPGWVKVIVGVALLIAAYWLILSDRQLHTATLPRGLTNVSIGFVGAWLILKGIGFLD
jgi:predicted phage tail protein